MTTATTPDTKLVLHDLGNEVQALVTQAEILEVKDQASYDLAAIFLKAIVSRRRKIDETFDPISEKQFAAFKETKAQKARFLDPTVNAERIVKGKIAAWDQEQEHLRQEEQRRLDAEAQQREEEDRLEAAIAAEEQGAAPEEVSAILDTPEPVPVISVAPRSYQPAQGISKARENWKGEVTSLLALVCHIAGVRELAHPELLLLVQPSPVAVNQVARAQKQLCRIPGMRVWNEPNIAVR